MSDNEEQLFSAEQTMQLKSMMASAVTDEVASLCHDKDHLKEGDSPARPSGGEYITSTLGKQNGHRAVVDS